MGILPTSLLKDRYRNVDWREIYYSLTGTISYSKNTMNTGQLRVMNHWPHLQAGAAFLVFGIEEFWYYQVNTNTSIPFYYARFFPKIMDELLHVHGKFFVLGGFEIGIGKRP